MWYGVKGIEYTERQMRWKIGKLRWKWWRKNKIDIVLAHAPPQGIHDGKDVCHKGFSSFLKLIDKYKPRYFIHGHTHKSYGYSKERITQINGTKVVNVEGYHVFEIGPLVQKKRSK